jgi:hypothetical protein
MPDGADDQSLVTGYKNSRVDIHNLPPKLSCKEDENKPNNRFWNGSCERFGDEKLNSGALVSKYKVGTPNLLFLRWFSASFQIES